MNTAHTPGAIVAGVDGSQAALQAVRWAAVEARSVQRLVHTVQWRADEAGEDQLRERVVRRLKKQSGFREHPLVYLRWSASRDDLGGDRLGDRGGHHAGIAYRPDEPNEERIHREMERLRSRL